PSIRLHVRIGLHVGEPVREEADYFGTTVVIARRLCDSARGGQVRASGLVRELVGSRGGFTFFNLGPLTLKGISDPLAAYEVIWETAATPAAKRLPVSRWVIGGGALAAAGIVAAVLLALLLSGGDGDSSAPPADGNQAPPAQAATGNLAFISDRGGKLGVHFVDADTSAVTGLPDIPGFEADLAWSPDRKRLAFTAKGTSGEPSPAQQTPGQQSPGGGGGGGGGGGRQGRGTQPAPQLQSENRDIFIVNIDGTAFTSARDGNREIYLMSPDGAALVRLTSNRADDFHPSWSPDGTRLAFTSERDGNRELYLIIADGSGLSRLTDDPADDSQPVWS